MYSKIVHYMVYAIIMAVFISCSCPKDTGWEGKKCDICNPHWTGAYCDKCLLPWTGKKCNELKQVAIGEQVWTAANMSETVGYDGSTLTCYANLKDDYDFIIKYGCLYNWPDAMKVCPNGWKLPSKKDYEVLLKTVNSNNNKELPNPAFFSLSEVRFRWESEYKKQITNSTGFSARPAGSVYGEHYMLESMFGIFLTSTEIDEENVYCLFIDNGGRVEIRGADKISGHSVRCIKD